MYNRFYTFLEKKKTYLLYPIWLQTKTFNNSSLNSLNKLIRKQLDDGSYGCGVFVDFQKAGKTLDHKILLKKLEHYYIKGTFNKWFASYLTNRNQYESINRLNSDLLGFICGVPQGSMLGILLFLACIRDLLCAIKYCNVYYFADDNNLINLQALLKQLINK